MTNPYLIVSGAGIILISISWLTWPGRLREQTSRGKHAMRAAVSHARRRSRADKEDDYYARYYRQAPRHSPAPAPVPAFPTLPDMRAIRDDFTIEIGPGQIMHQTPEVPLTGPRVCGGRTAHNHGELPGWVISELGAESVDAAIAAICGW